MKAEITLKNLYYNPSVRNFFFRTQSENEFNTVCNLANNVDEMLDYIDDSELFSDLDDFEEYLYNSSTDEIIEYIGKEYFNSEEEY